MSPEPREKVTLRVLPPPQPSFFTRNCSLWEEEEAWAAGWGPSPSPTQTGRGGSGPGARRSAPRDWRVARCAKASPRMMLGWGVRVAEGEGQGPPCRLLEALAQKADELRLEDALQEAVGGVLLEDEEVVLPRAGKWEERQARATGEGGARTNL